MHIRRVRATGYSLMHVAGIRWPMAAGGTTVMQQTCITEEPTRPARDLCITDAGLPRPDRHDPIATRMQGRSRVVEVETRPCPD